jgi:hypothetical protein
MFLQQHGQIIHDKLTKEKARNREGKREGVYELPAELHSNINLKMYIIIQAKDQCTEVTRLPAVPLMFIGYI